MRISSAGWRVNSYKIFDAALLLGGYKQSGWGREMGEEAIHDHTETKWVCIALQRRKEPTRNQREPAPFPSTRGET